MVLPSTASWCEWPSGTVTNSERRVQRVRKAVDAPGEARDDQWIICELARAPRPRLGPARPPEQAWDELRSLSPMHGGMSYARLEELGGIQWPCPTRTHPGSPFLHGRLWAEPVEGPRAPFSVVVHAPPVDELDDEFPIRLTTGRRLDSYNTGVQTGLYRSPLRRGETLDLSPEGRRAARRRATARSCASRRAAARVEAPVRLDPGLRPGLAFMTLHFPDEVDANVLTIDATDPKSGTAEFKATAVRVEKINGRRPHRGRARRAAGPAGQWTCGCSMPSRRRPSATRSTRSLGPPLSSWDGGAERSDDDGHSADGGHAAREQRHLLLPALHALQARVGWISPGGLGYICRRLTVPPADVYGVATFYALLAVEPRPPRVVHVCDDIACRCRGLGGADRRARGARRARGQRVGDWLRSPCLGQCDRAPAALLTDAGETPVERELPFVAADGVVEVLAGATPAPPASPRPRQAGDPACGCCGASASSIPTSLDDYRAHGGYARAAARVRARAGGRDPRGHGLASWSAAAARRSRPGASGRRSRASRDARTTSSATPTSPSRARSRTASLIEGDPFAVVEAMTIAALRDRLRARLRLPARRVPARRAPARGRASRQARERGFLGDGHPAAPGFAFDIEIRKGAGAYICGEETAIFNSIEGYRGEPRNKPPFPVVEGLFGKPTVVNNVETLVNVLDIVARGRPRVRRRSAPRNRRARSCSACRARSSGPASTRCRSAPRCGELLELAGGVAGGPAAAGGAARRGRGRVRGPRRARPAADLRGRARERGATLGSGVVLVIDDAIDLAAHAACGSPRSSATSRCGQCVPCRVGTVRQQEALARLRSGATRGTAARRAGADRRDRAGDARRLDLRSRARPRRARSSPRSQLGLRRSASR